MRTEKELWEVVLSRPDLFVKSLCFWLIEVESSDLISYQEYSFLDGILDSESDRLGVGYFIGTPHEIQPRIDWIKKRIEGL